MTEAPHKIEFWQTLGSAFRFVWLERRDLAALATLPIVVLAIATAFTQSQDPTGGEIASMNAGLLFFQFVLSSALYTMFAVAWHRKYLVPDETLTVGAALTWGRRQFRFLGWLVAFSAVMSVPSPYLISADDPSTAFPGAPVLVFFAMIASIAVLPAYGRVLPMFPSVAVDETLRLTDCWALTKRNGWRLLWLSVLPFVPLVVLQLALVAIISATAAAIELDGALSVMLLTALVGQSISYAGIAVAVSALSMAYYELRTART